MLSSPLPTFIVMFQIGFSGALLRRCRCRFTDAEVLGQKLVDSSRQTLRFSKQIPQSGSVSFAKLAQAQRWAVPAQNRNLF